MTSQTQSRRQFRRRAFGLLALLQWIVALDGRYRQAQAFKRLSPEARKDMGLPKGEAPKAGAMHDARW